MSKLYAQLAQVYEAMYYTFIDYKAEYQCYSQLLQQQNKKSLVELGCGTGNLAGYFLQNDFDYCGLDLSEEMINIAKSKLPNAHLMQADMRHFSLEKTVEGAIMTGRTISYLRTYEEVKNMICSVHNNLEKGGLFCFDFIDASRFIPAIVKDGHRQYEASHREINYRREDLWQARLQVGMDVIWDAVYSQEIAGEFVEIGRDHSIVRTFTQNEIDIWLTINGFNVQTFIDKPSYAFPTYVVVAERG